MIAERIFGIILAALLGGTMGSFSNVLAIRWHEAASLSGRSKCPECGHTIRPRHLVPVVSWILLRGRCADCKTKIHIQYPLVEATAILLGVIAAVLHDPISAPGLFFVQFILTVGLIAPIVMDLRWQELPVEYLAGLGVFAVAARTVGSVLAGEAVLLSLLWSIAAIVGAVLFFGAQVVLSRGKWLGEGDIWFGAMMGAMLGTPALTGVGIYLAYIVGGIWAFAGLVSGLYKRGSRLPFAPALAAGTMVALWHGERILTWISRGFA